jgi:hypothetical protein
MADPIRFRRLAVAAALLLTAITPAAAGDEALYGFLPPGLRPSAAAKPAPAKGEPERARPARRTGGTVAVRPHTPAGPPATTATVNPAPAAPDAAATAAPPAASTSAPAAAPAATTPPAAVTTDATADDVARFLAGLAPSATSPLQPLTKQGSWQRHASRFDAAWARLDQGQLAKIRDWTKAAMPRRQSVVFYNFAGPDFLYADAVLPGAATYVLSGLEPVGSLPDAADLKKAVASSELAQFEGSLNSVLSFSFFITKKMKTELRNRHIDGTLPVLLVFLARSGKSVQSVELIALDGEGSVHPAGEAGLKTAAPGVKIAFTAPGDAQPRTLYYLSTNIENGSVERSGYLAFCDKLGTGDSLVKSASYLLHMGSFAEVRNFLLSHSATLVQDDSGIPLKYFDKSWRLQPYGTYVQPLDLFPGTYQAQMRTLFNQKHPGLAFGIGYRHHARDSNLVVATRLGE